jgi:VWFA-related protein
VTVRRLVVCVAAAAAGALLPALPSAQGPARSSLQQPPARVFRLGTNVVRVDVVVRDKDGHVVNGLTSEDFAITEDGKPQMITSFDFEQIATERLPELTSTPALLGRDRLQSAAARAATTTAAATPAPANVAPEDLPGRRLIVLLFDTSSMQPEEIDRAVKSANDYVDANMSTADLVAVATVGQTLSVLGDFTADRAQLKSILAGFDSTSGTGFEQPAAADTDTDATSTDTSTDTDAADLPLDDSEFGIFNNDRRLRALRVLCEALAPIEQKKAILYFSAGMSRSGSDNQVELRAVINAANKANTSIYPVDSRGLTAVVPGGAAGRGGGGFSSSAFSGRSMLNQFSSLGSSQETLTTLAADTGGEAFLDTNDFSPAFTRVQHDMSAYYLLGYSSTNPAQDGKFRRISVTLKHPVAGYQVDARRGYYAPTDFMHLRKEDRERQLEDQISAAVSSTDLPVVASTSWFRVSGDRFYVPVSVAVPGSAVHLPAADAKDRGEATIDLLGVVTDEQGRSVGRIRDAMRIPAAQAGDLAGKQLQYQSGVLLPAGHFKVKVAARENTDGTMGTFEFPITIPDLQTEPVKVSPVVFSTQIRVLNGAGRGFRGRAGGFGPGGFGRGFGGPGFRSERGGGAQWSANSQNPLLRDGQEIVQSLTHVATPGQPMYFYYEVYDPAVSASGAPKIDTSLAFYRGRVKVFETPVVERTTIDAPDRHAVIFQFELPANDLKPGLYTCQVNVIDEVSGRFAFPRLAVYVRGQ